MEQIIRRFGDCIVVSDEEIINAWKELARKGLLVEYSSATTLAAYKKDKRKEGEKNVLVLTGSGLKTL
jgi:threonine synthase